MAGAPFPLEHKRCERARQWSSLRIDGELSELEGALLDRHLGVCGPCLAFDRQLQASATALRAAPLEVPRRRFEFPEQPRIRIPVSRRVAVAGIAAALALGSLVGSVLHSPASKPVPVGPQISLLTRDMNQLRQIPRGTKVPPAAPARDPGEPPEGII